jgi:hypothetical protein
VLLLAAALTIHVNSKGFLNEQGHDFRMGYKWCSWTGWSATGIHCFLHSPLDIILN